MVKCLKFYVRFTFYLFGTSKYTKLPLQHVISQTCVAYKFCARDNSLKMNFDIVRYVYALSTLDNYY